MSIEQSDDQEIGTLLERQQRYFNKLAIQTDRQLSNQQNLQKSENLFKKNRAAI